MIYITGDIHGEVFRVADAVKRFQITSEDMIVILGDVGMNYYGNNHGDRHRKKKLNKLGVPIFCIHGNHEMQPSTIDSYHEVQWKDGTVYIEDEYPNLLYAKDGEVYDLGGRKTLVIGGAYSVDKWYRLRMNMNWFPDEQPSTEIKARVEQKLEELGWKVDAVLSHTCPERYMPVEAFLSGIDQSTVVYLHKRTRNGCLHRFLVLFLSGCFHDFSERSFIFAQFKKNRQPLSMAACNTDVIGAAPAWFGKCGFW